MNVQLLIWKEPINFCNCHYPNVKSSCDTLSTSGCSVLQASGGYPINLSNRNQEFSVAWIFMTSTRYIDFGQIIGIDRIFQSNFVTTA